MVKSSEFHVALGQQVLVENGYEHLFVDGTCQFWVKASETAASDPWAPIRTGQLDPEERRHLEEAVDWEEWSCFDELYGGRGADAATHLFDNPSTTFGCIGRCEDAPSGVEDIKSGIRGALLDLYESGENISDGPGRVHVVELEAGLSGVYPTILDWPLTRPPTELAISRAEAGALEYGNGIPVSPSEATILRALRDEFRAGDHGAFYDVMPFRYDGVTYQVFYRDVVPYENDDGLIVF